MECEEGWKPKSWCFWTVVLEKTLRVPWTARRSSQPILKEISPEYLFTARTDAEAKTLLLWPPDVKNQLLRKDPASGKDWRQEEKGMSEDEKFGWHHPLYGCEFEQALGVGDGQGSLAYWSPWSRKELDMTKLLNWTELAFLKLNFQCWEISTGHWTNKHKKIGQYLWE